VRVALRVGRVPGVVGGARRALRPKRLVIASRWVPKPRALAGELRPRRLNHQPLRLTA
jgi:hypothetical protein